MSEFGVPTGEEADKDKFSKALCPYSSVASRLVRSRILAMKCGKQEWHGRKLVLVNAGEIQPEIMQTVIPIPDTRPNETIKIATDINASGFEGTVDCKWEMQDADGGNCFPNYTWDFNIQICVTFMEVDS